MNRRDIIKSFPAVALIPTFAHSKEELEKKLDDIKAKYLILVNPIKFDLEVLALDENGLRNENLLTVDAEVWPIQDLEPPIQIFKLE